MRCAVVVSPAIVDAGAQMTLRAEVSCSPPCDLRGHTLLITDQDGAGTGTIALAEFDGETNRTNAFALTAPVAAGEHRWSALCPAVERDGTSYSEVSAPISFSVAPHTTYVVAWDVPSHVVAGERFKMKVGMKCSSGCRLADSAFAIHDHEGRQAAVGTVTDARWPGTAGLYVAEAELEAPAAEGLYTWGVRRSQSDSGIPHAEGSIDFGVRVVGRPEHLVTIEAVEKVTRAPLSAARVVMHPYRSVADEQGVARIRASSGTYRLFVSQTNYITSGQSIDVAADMTVEVELDLEPVLERN